MSGLVLFLSTVSMFMTTLRALVYTCLHLLGTRETGINFHTDTTPVSVINIVCVCACGNVADDV